jgi:hypothetical protein
MWLLTRLNREQTDYTQLFSSFCSIAKLLETGILLLYLPHAIRTTMNHSNRVIVPGNSFWLTTHHVHNLTECNTILLISDTSSRRWSHKLDVLQIICGKETFSTEPRITLMPTRLTMFKL